MSDISLVILGLWDGKDSGIQALSNRILGTYLVCPQNAFDSGIGLL